MTGFTDAALGELRADFPILEQIGRGGREIAYFDSAATSQKPRPVIAALVDFYSQINAPVSRGTHLLGDLATAQFESAREEIAQFLGSSPNGLIFTKNATEALNLVANAFASPLRQSVTPTSSLPQLGPDDEIVVTRLEHHANLVPWQRVCAATGATLRVLEANAEGRLELEKLPALISKRTKVIAFTHLSNVTGARTEVASVVEAAHACGAYTVLDSCQSTAHEPFDFSALEVDFAVASGHKMLGPTGIGALVTRPELCEQLPRFLTGGSMVAQVSLTEATYQNYSLGLEAGTQPVAQAIGWAAAVNYLSRVGMEKIAEHETFLGQMFIDGLKQIPTVKLLGPDTMTDRGSVFSFSIPGVHPHDVGQFLDAKDLAIRVGHHCAMPAHEIFGVRSSSRASMSLTNTAAEVNRLLEAIAQTADFFGGNNG